jgi:hypothetical protein
MAVLSFYTKSLGDLSSAQPPETPFEVFGVRPICGRNTQPIRLVGTLFLTFAFDSEETVKELLRGKLSAPSMT